MNVRTCPSFEAANPVTERGPCDEPAPKGLWIWNTFMVASSITLLVVDQKGPLGDAAKWFFCALLFAALKGAMKFCVS